MLKIAILIVAGLFSNALFAAESGDHLIEKKPSNIQRGFVDIRKTAFGILMHPRNTEYWQRRLDFLVSGSTVLDVGAGNGRIAERMQKELSCDVHALEPELCNIPNAFEKCVSILGEDRVKKLTLQDALKQNPEQYSGKFDFALVSQPSLYYAERDGFCKALACVIKPQGWVVITTNEIDKALGEDDWGAPLSEWLRKYFEYTRIEGVTLDDGKTYWKIMCNKPYINN